MHENLDAEVQPGMPLDPPREIAEGTRDLSALRRTRLWLRALTAVAEALAGQGEPILKLQQIAELIVPSAASYCGVGMLESDGSVLWRGVAHDRNGAIPAQFRQRMAGARDGPEVSGIFRTALRTGQPQFARLLSEMLKQADLPVSPTNAPRARSSGLISLLAVPLVARGSLLGVIECLAVGPEKVFTRADLPLLESLARAIALALDNAQLQQQARHARERLERMQRVSATLSAAATIAEVSAAMITEGVAALEAREGTLALLSENGTQLRVIHTAGYLLHAVPIWTAIPLDAGSPVAEAVRTGELVVVGTPTAVHARIMGETKSDARPDVVTVAAVPLKQDGRTLGALAVQFAEQRQFSADDRSSLITLGSLCAQALERARLYEAERSARSAAETGRGRVQLILEQAPAIIAVLRGPNHVFEVANRLYTQQSGRSASDLMGRPVRQAFPELENQGLFEMLDQVYRTGTPVSDSEVPMSVDRDGDGIPEDYYFTYSCQPIRGADGAVESLIVLGSDVTEQVLARREVEQLSAQVAAGRDRLRQVLDRLPVAALLVDVEGRIELANRAYGELRGLAVRAGSSAAYGMRHADGNLYAIEDTPLQRALTRGTETHGEEVLFYNAVTGADVPALMNAAPLRNVFGIIDGAVAVFQDITAIKDLDRQREEFLSTVTHDLKNPLTVILSMGQLLQNRVASLAEGERRYYEDGLRRVVDTAQRAARMVDGLLDVARLQIGRPLDLNLQPVDLVSMLHSLLLQLRQSGDRHVVTFDVQEDHFVIQADAARLERALTNVLGNALKYSPKGGRITVMLRRTEESGSMGATVRIADQGIGIPADDLPRVFDRFFRGSNVLAQFQGTGVGLASVRQIVEQHGGAVSIESSEGNGTTVTIRLPGSPAPAG